MQRDSEEQKLVDHDFVDDDFVDHDWHVFAIAASPLWVAATGVLWLTGSAGWEQALSVAWIPLWLPPPLFAAYPVFAFLRGPVRRASRRKRGECIVCADAVGESPPLCLPCHDRLRTRQAKVREHQQANRARRLASSTSSVGTP